VALYCVLKHRITSFNTFANSSTSVKINTKNIDVSKVQILTLAVYNDKKHTKFIVSLSITPTNCTISNTYK